ncbi:carboxymuconolactone decarboxylase family protein [Elongatibacter sediminis]|uniref:Peroxidase-related enzyme n=1 Tax=Elongatibacter sediminis TaxID=3119006 RepID=A0AAW9R6U8_9GAMM
MRLKSLPDDAKVYDLFARRPATFQPFVDVCEKIMRGPSSLTAGQRELIGTFVSALNQCPYCHDVHNEAVKAHGLDAELAKQAKEDLDSAAIDPRLKPLFALVRKSTESAWRVTDADFDAAYEAGWDDDAIQDAVLVACLFNFMNRLVSTLGIEADADYLSGAGSRLRDEGYAGSLEQAIE